MRHAYLAAGVAALLLASPALAVDDIASDRVDLGADADTVDAQRERWQQRFISARGELAEARQRRSAARDAYVRMRHRDRERGDEKAQIMRELTAAEAAVVAAKAALEQLSETARKAGVPPGWLRTLRAESPASPAGSRQAAP